MDIPETMPLSEAYQQELAAWVKLFGDRVGELFVEQLKGIHRSRTPSPAYLENCENVKAGISQLVDIAAGWSRPPPAPDDLVRVSKLLADQSVFSQQTFGEDSERGPVGALRHLSEEALEAAAEPTDITEYADCFLLLMDATRRAGWTFEQLVQAAAAKLEVNKNRTWVKQADETFQHEEQPDEPGQAYKCEGFRPITGEI